MEQRVVIADGRNHRRPASPFAGDEGLVVLAHRGGGGRWPENTMLAFQNAADLGVDGLEMDIQATADGELVVIHDDVVDRVTEGKGRVPDLMLAELRQLDAGYCWTADGGQSYPFRGQGLTIPTLREVVERFPDLWINVDIKQHRPSIVEPFVQLINQFDMADRMMVGSFDGPTVARFRRLLPEVATAATEGETRRLYLLSRLWLPFLYRGPALALQIPERHGRTQIVTPRFIRAAHGQGTAVHVWTVDEEADMQRLIALGVDALITDYPDRLLRLLGRLEK